MCVCVDGLLCVVQERGPELSTGGAWQQSMHRVLHDQYKALSRYDRIEAKNRSRAMGLGKIPGGFELLKPWNIKAQEQPEAD